jgi:hypothetical protein
MPAYKFTAAGGVGLFTGFPWPVPVRGRPGAWVGTEATIERCLRGVHACRIGHLPYWFGPELWEIELGGEVTQSAYKLVATKGRLVRRVEGWPELDRPFAEDCATRTRGLALEGLRRAGRGREASRLESARATADLVATAQEAAARPGLATTLVGYAADCAMDVDNQYYAMCAYVTATAFGNWSTGDSEQDMSSPGWVEERSRQASWLADRLGLTES